MSVKIEIVTAQHVVIEYQLASLSERFLAMFIDLLLFYVALMFALFAVSSLFAYFSVIFVPAFLAYHIFSEWFLGGQSLGKRSIGIKVLQSNGDLPTFDQSLLRGIFYLLDFFATAGSLGVLLIGTTYRNQRLGDLAAGTLVIRMKSNLTLNLNSILKIDNANYTFTYEGVKNFEEQQIIVIKEALNKYRKYQNEVYRNLLIDLADKCSLTLGVKRPSDYSTFLHTIVKDYVMLTR
jgi:uncharacterized RDD family membrane protein YckC